MVSKGQFVGLDWNRITRLHSQVMIGSEKRRPEIRLCPQAKVEYVQKRINSGYVHMVLGKLPTP